MNRVVVLVVPGRDDRTFYKRFLMSLAKRLSTKVVYEDLDQRKYEEERIRIISSIVKTLKVREKDVMRQYAVIRLKNMERHTNLDVIISLPGVGVPGHSGGKNPTARIAGILVSLLLGSHKHRVGLIAAVEDAEEHDFRKRLESLENSLRDVLGDDVEIETKEEGSYYRLYLAKKKGVAENEQREMQIMLMVQGLRETEKILPYKIKKHALEDFLLYAGQDILKSVPDVCKEILAGHESKLHKKLVLLLLAYGCYVQREEFVMKTINEKVVGMLIELHDGLRKLYALIEEMLER